MSTAYRTSPTKGRRSAADVRRIKDAICRLLEEDNPMTVRQVYYRLVSEGEIEKTEGEYKQTVCRLLGSMRRESEIPFGWIADNTRWMRKPRTYSSLESMLDKQKQLYRRSLWDDQDAYVEVWLEKDALAVMPEQIEEWDLPTRPTKTSDSRGKNFDGESVEVDAIPPNRLRNLVRACVEQHIDADSLARTQKVEDAERATLATLIDNLKVRGGKQ